MTARDLFRVYAESAALLGLGAVVFSVAQAVAARSPGPSAARWLRFGQLAFVAALAFPAAAFLVPGAAIWKPTAQVFSGGHRVAHAAAGLSVGEAATRAVLVSSRALEASSAILPLVLVLLGGIGIGLARFGIALGRLRALVEASPVARRIGRVTVLVSDSVGVPISFWLARRAYVVLPSALLSRADDWSIAMRHEIQHHRQRDTLWAHGVEIVKALYFWNPAIYAWARLFAHAQEFACDEVLTTKRRIAPGAYGGCLLRAAESAVRGRAVPVGTTGMAASASGHLLKRRLHMMTKYGSARASRLPWMVTAGTLLFMATAALAARGAARDRELTIAEAREIAARSASEIPLAVNELVLKQLNRFVGTAEGREFIRRALARHPQYKTLVDAKTSQYKLPYELWTVPILESGYKNFKPPHALGSGLWGFVKGTARRYGLVVDDTVDERLDAEKETDAAMRYFRDLFDQFHDWRLALKAYNEGENRVKFLIEELGTWDPWAIEMKIEGSEQYLAKMTAILLIVKNPALLD